MVYLDGEDRKMILIRSTMKSMLLSQCGIDKSRRFAFYDQVHTTGMDIKHAVNAMAVVTLGKDMTFRDYAQGAFRMRGIGQGQTIMLYIIPEVLKLIKTHMISAETGKQVEQLLLERTLDEANGGVAPPEEVKLEEVWPTRTHMHTRTPHLMCSSCTCWCVCLRCALGWW